MHIPVGISLGLKRVRFTAEFMLPKGVAYDFEIFSIVIHECPHDWTFNIAVMGFNFQFAYIKKINLEEMFETDNM